MPGVGAGMRHVGNYQNLEKSCEFFKTAWLQDMLIDRQYFSIPCKKGILFVCDLGLVNGI